MRATGTRGNDNRLKQHCEAMLSGHWGVSERARRNNAAGGDSDDNHNARLQPRARQPIPNLQRAKVQEALRGHDTSASWDERATEAHPWGDRQQAPDRCRGPSQHAGSSPAVLGATNDERTSDILQEGYRQRAPERCGYPSQPAGSEVVVTSLCGFTLVTLARQAVNFTPKRSRVALDSQSGTRGTVRFTLHNLKTHVARHEGLARLQGAPCLSHSRGNRGGVLDEPYGGGTTPPPPGTTRHEVGGRGDNERGLRKVKVGDAQEGHSILLMAESRAPRR